MLTLALLGLCAFALAASFALHVRRVHASLRGQRIVTCPESGLPAVVEMDAAYSAVRSAFGRPHVRLQECSRWPERAGCGQTCLGDVEASPEDTRVTTMIDQFYTDRRCALCGWAFGSVRNDHAGLAVLGPDGATREWGAFAADTLSSVLRSHAPVCRNCHVGQTFRRRHPEIFRPMPPMM
jgi:hypothetical protein